VIYSWLLVALIIASTTTADLLQSAQMKAHGEVNDFRPSGIWSTVRGLARKPLLVLSILCMAISFFAFTVLLSVADLSFAVPATAGSLVVETILARWVLREQVDSRRWAGVMLVAGGVALLAV
jgi:drug/metabolite transporter (DMT)-like permease